MKLVLANNHSPAFTAFYARLQQASSVPFDYAAYETWLFRFGVTQAPGVSVVDTSTGRQLCDYDGVYINGYLNTYELAATMAICCQALCVPFANQEFANPPSLSKLTSYAKLAAASVPIPRTIAGARRALLQAAMQVDEFTYPAVLKRADADRGIDNYKVADASAVREVLRVQPPDSLWLLQEYLENDGFYLVSFYDQKPVFSIFRSLQPRPDKDPLKAHIYKPKGGQNASLIEVDDLPAAVRTVSQQAIDAMDRQIGSVDTIYMPSRDRAYVLEVNYNPQLVTITTFQEVRQQSFLDGIARIGKEVDGHATS